MMTNLDKVLDAAFSAYNQGDLNQAENLVREVLSAIPNQGDGLYLLALIAYQKGALTSAIDILFQTLKLYPDIDNYRLLLASILQEQGRLNEALQHYQKCPNHPNSLTEQGFIYWKQGKEKQALEHFKKALKISPQLPSARLGIILLQRQFKKLEQLANETNLPDAWFYLARHYYQKHQLDMALNAINNTGLKEVAYLIEKGLILEAQNNLSEALKTYQLAAERNPYRTDVWTNQANIFKKNNDLSAAENYYKRALSQDATDLITRYNLADLMYQMNRIPEALDQYRFILAHHPTDEIALYNLGIILEKTGNFSEALGLYFNLLIKNKNIKNIYWRISDSISSLSEQGKDAQKLALQFSKGWLKLDPENPIAKHIHSALTHQKENDLAAYTELLYDDFAETYQDKMRELKSITIDEISHLIPLKKYSKVLDLGCGIGSFGQVFSKNSLHLTGVDISNNMLNKAKETKCYQKLVHQDILSFLSKTKIKYDLITTIEVLEYLTNLDGLLGQIQQHLTKDGLFAFSIETCTDTSHLETNGRYVYNKTEVIEKLEKFKFSILNQKEINLRREKTSFANGMIFVCGL